MSHSTTPNLGLSKPAQSTVRLSPTDPENWGVLMNANLDTLDAVVQKSILSEVSGSSSAALATVEATLITLASLTVVAGDRIELFIRSANFGDTLTSEYSLSVQQSAGTATGTWVRSGGTATTTLFTVALGSGAPAPDNNWTQSPVAYVVVTGSGTCTFILKGAAGGGNAAGGSHVMTAVVVKGS